MKIGTVIDMDISHDLTFSLFWSAAFEAVGSEQREAISLLNHLSQGVNVFVVECYFTYFGSTVENSKENFSHPNKFFS